MEELSVEIRTTDGTADGFLFQGLEPKPGVIYLTDIGGIRPSQHQMARRLAEQGFTVLMPNLFYRTGRPPVAQFPLRPGPDNEKRLGELRGPLTPEAVQRDANAYIDFLTAQTMVGMGPIGVVGYCFSGAVALRIAAARPKEVAAAASFHGGRLYTDDPDSPHLLLPKIRARLYFGHAVQDRSMPAEAIEKFEEALRAWGGEYESETYEGAFHSWTTLDSPVYNQPQAERAFAQLTELLSTSLRH
ncbi:MAG: dienelactone hydrolase family protein [Acidobacteriaceae bacterium]